MSQNSSVGRVIQKNKSKLFALSFLFISGIALVGVFFYSSQSLPEQAQATGYTDSQAISDLKVPESVELNGILVALQNPATSDVTVNYQVTGGTAVSGEDYELPNGNVTIPAGKSEATIPIKIINDDVYEPNETIEISLSNSGGSLVNDSVVKYTILNEDTSGYYVQGAATLPSAVSDLQLWLESRDETTLNLDTGDKVTEWADKSGQNNHFTQTDPNYQPTYDNTDKALIFDGSDDFLSNSDILVSTDFTNQEVTMIAVYEPNDTNYSLTDTGSSTSGYWRYSGNGNGYFDDFRSVRLESNPTDMPSSGKHVVTMQSDNTANTYKVWLNNDLKTQVTPNWGVQTDFLLGKGGGGPLNGKVYALALYNRALNDLERQSVENYLLSNALSGIFTEDTELSGLTLHPFNNSLNSEEYITFKSDGNPQQIISTDLPSGTTQRWDRSWEVNKTSMDGVDIGMIFDFAQFAGGYPGEASNYKLLYRATNTGNFTDLGLTPQVVGNQVQFEVLDTNLQDGFYTLGTTNQTNSPLEGDPKNYPSTIENLTLFEREADSVKTAWVEPNGNGFAVNDYKIQVSNDFFQENIVTLNDGLDNNNEYTIDGIQANNYRHVRILAVNQAGHSEVGNVSTIEEGGSGKILHLQADSVDPNDPDQVRIDGSDQYITKWEDISGNYKDAVMTNEGRQPKLVSNSVNGLPVIRFEAVDYFSLPTNVNSSPSDYTFFVVFNSTNDGRIFDTRTGRLILESNATYHDGNWRGASADTSNYQLVTWKLDDILGGKVFINGSEHASGSYNQRSVSSNTTIGADYNGNHGFVGDIAEIIVFNQSLQDEPRQSQEAALCNKYGLTCTASETSNVDNIDNPPDGVYNDAYKYEDGFKNSSGINFNETDGFNNISGWIEATKQTSTVTSQCFDLPQPEGGQFQKWLFMDMRVYDLTDTTGNILKLQSCDGNQDIKTYNDLSQGTNSFDLRDIDPSLYPNLRLEWTVDHTGVPSPSTLGAKVDWWKVNGMSTGVTEISVEPQGLITQTSPNSYPNFFFNYTSNGAKAYNARLVVPLDDINGWHTPGIDDGLSEDAEVDYGSGLFNYRGITFHEGIPGPSGEPLINATSGGRGDIYWNLVTIDDGFSGQVNAKVSVPVGYVNLKDFAVRSYMRFGEQPANSLGFDASMTVDDISPRVEVFRQADFYVHSNHYQISKDGFDVSNQNFLPNSTGLSAEFRTYSNYYHYKPDIEDLTATIDLSGGTCNPLYQGLRRQGSNPSWTHQIYWTNNPGVSPQPGDPITGPITLHIDRTYFQERFFLDFDLDGSNCQQGDTFTYNTNFYSPPNPNFWDQTINRTYTVDEDIYRTLAHTNYRILYEDSRGVTSYNPNDYQSIGSASHGYFKPGEYFLSYYYNYKGDHRNPPNNAHNVVLDHSYNVVNLNGLSFHGIRDGEYNDRGYKSCDPNILLPDDPAFDHSNPLNSGWSEMDVTWNGNPWTLAPDMNDPTSVV
jgi:hypothetical protein